MGKENMSKRHGNDRFWCFLEDDIGKETAVWRKLDASRDMGPEDNDVVCRCPNRYYAMEIVDAMILKENTDKDRGIATFGPRELAFLEFVQNSGPEPQSTMARLAIIWNDWERYNELKEAFPSYYK